MKFLILNVMVLLSVSAYAANDSTYTSVDAKDCKTIKSSELDKDAPIDYYTGECKGLGGYGIIVSGGDIRYAISLKYNGKEIELTHIPGFHDLGSKKIEWRGPVANGKIAKFTSLIYRLNISHYNDQTNDNVNEDSLFVARLNGAKSCVIARIRKSPNMNEQARVIADDMSAPCIQDTFE